MAAEAEADTGLPTEAERALWLSVTRGNSASLVMRKGETLSSRRGIATKNWSSAPAPASGPYRDGALRSVGSRSSPGAEGSSSHALVRERSKLRPGICTWLWGIFSYCFIMENLKHAAQLKALCSDAGTTLSGFNHYCFTILSF